jgi:hypothetical protein
MYRKRLLGLTAVLALAAGPAGAIAGEWDEGFTPDGSETATSERGNGAEVSVDLEGSTPGLTPELFRSTLSAHGDWYASPRYGEVWRPRVGVGWRPYYYGTWLWTDEGWYWDSDEPFAWAVYHYGRWVYDPAWSWVWVPGYQWAPAWVTWRFADDVVGWSPLAPGVSVFVTSYPFVDFWWTFVPTVRFVGVPVYTVAYAPRETRRWYSATRPAPPRTAPAPRQGTLTVSPAWGGPPRGVVESRLGRAIVAERRAPALAPPSGRTDRAREPAWTPPRGGADRGERGRPGVVPAPRGEPARPAFVPPPRGEPTRPAFVPPPRGEPARPSFQPPDRGGSGGGGARERPGRRDR